jgi:Carbohydrate esterase, sialic acid-specific acetylesterase
MPNRLDKQTNTQSEMKQNHSTLGSFARSSLALTALALSSFSTVSGEETPIPKPDGKPADMTRPVQVFILMGQSNMVGKGRITGDEGSLENAVKTKNKYSYLVDDAGAWTERMDVRFVRYMSGKGPLNNEWMGIKKGTIGPEFGIAHPVGNAIDAPVMILKSCIGNRSLAWDLLPPGSERFVEGGKVYAGYKDRPDSWDADPAKGVATEPPAWLDKNGKPVEWWAGLQYDLDVADAKKALADLATHYPGATKCEVAGFFFWQGEKDCGNPVHAARYEKNLVAFIKALRKDFNAPNAKFVLATLGESTKGSTGNGGKVLEAQLAVDGSTGKYPEFKGNVATVYANPLSKGGSGNDHYDGNAETYMDVGEAMGKAMVNLLKN